MQNTVLILQCQMPAELTGGNSQRKHLKLIWWEKNGFCIAQKIIEKGRWPWPETKEEAKEIKLDEVIMLLKGIDFFCTYEPMKFKDFD